MPFSSAPILEVQDLGRIGYADATEQMLALVDQRAAGELAADRILFCEFEPVLTVGRGEDIANYEKLGLPVHSVSRGGKATYHGPGQVVAYPILALQDSARDLHAYLRALEEALILTVGDFGLEGGRDERFTGCWVNGRKIASIGVAVRKWVTYHGVALNVTTDLDWFKRFDPCGLDPEVMTSLSVELEEAPALVEVQEALACRLTEVLRS